MYAPLDDAVYDAAAEAEAALAALASALLAIEAAEAQKVQDALRSATTRAEAARTACREFELELQGAVGLEPAESAQLTASCQSCARRLQPQSSRHQTKPRRNWSLS